jgi:hypothetical protein
VKLVYVLYTTFDFIETYDLFDIEKYVKNIEDNKERLENLYFFLMAVMITSVMMYTKKGYTFTYLEKELIKFFGMVLMFKLTVDFLKKYEDEETSIFISIIDFMTPFT